MNPILWILVGVVLCVVVLAIGICVGPAILCLVGWFNWKRRQLRHRKEWTQENPYWRESFAAGVKWAEEQALREHERLKADVERLRNLWLNPGEDEWPGGVITDALRASGNYLKGAAGEFGYAHGNILIRLATAAEEVLDRAGGSAAEA